VYSVVLSLTRNRINLLNVELPMKYTIYVNQAKAIDLGLTNINQAMIFDLLTTASTWAKATHIDGEVYYWVARQAIVKELPILGLKPDTAYRHLKALADLGLIDYKKDGKKDCIRITNKGKSYLSNTMSETDPSDYVGNESELPTNSEMNPKKLGNESENNSEMNPTYPTTNTNHTTNLSNTNAIAVSDQANQFESFWKAYPKKSDKAKSKLAYAKAIKKASHQLIIQSLINQKNVGQWGSLQFTPMATTWLNGERWEDDLMSSNGVNNNSIEWANSLEEIL
jgi:DNA-binding transcriptional ArsR family regulator